MKKIKTGEISRSNQHLTNIIIGTANALALVFSGIYLSHPVENIFYNVVGIYLFIVLIGNLVAVVVSHQRDIVNYGYIIFSSISMLVIPIANTITATSPGNISSRSYIAIAFILVEFAAGCFIFVIGYLTPYSTGTLKKNLEQRDSLRKRILIIAVILVSCVILIFAIIVCYDLLTRRNSGILEVFLPEYALFFGMYFLSVAAFAVKLSKLRFKLLSYGTGILGIIIFIITLVPILSTPTLINNANRNYIEAFGEPSELIENISKFKNLPFSVPEYLFGIVSGDYVVKENVLYYAGIEGVDKGIKLYFDVYMPVEDVAKLPGKGATLIRIHGGAWNIGDKGSSNEAQYNKYFASQGYVVFDIQYGLNNQDKFVSYSPVQPNVEGEFDIDDMVRQIGIFTTYLYDHKSTYLANTDSVFISGGSAGGQLTTAVGLALANGNYTTLLDSRIKVKGIIPFYPANGLAKIGGQDELVNPALLVDKNSPPCLIYQGTHDGIVNPQIATDLKSAYTNAENEACALIMMPFASHGSDFYFSSYYNQVFLYYMERFMQMNQ